MLRMFPDRAEANSPFLDLVPVVRLILTLLDCIVRVEGPVEWPALR